MWDSEINPAEIGMTVNRDHVDCTTALPLSKLDVTGGVFRVSM
jgi:hypothetical protein